MFVEISDISTILNSKYKNYRFGSLFLYGYGDIAIQIYKGKIEGMAMYGVLDTGYIELNNPIYINFKQYLEYNEDNKKIDVKYYL